MSFFDEYRMLGWLGIHAENSFYPQNTDGSLHGPMLDTDRAPLTVPSKS
jgi:hypothetical protein